MWVAFLSRHPEISEIRNAPQPEKAGAIQKAKKTGTENKESGLKKRKIVKRMEGMKQEVKKCLKKVQVAKRKYSTRNVKCSNGKKQRMDESDSESEKSYGSESEDDSEEKSISDSDNYSESEGNNNNDDDDDDNDDTPMYCLWSKL